MRFQAFSLLNAKLSAALSDHRGTPGQPGRRVNELMGAERRAELEEAAIDATARLLFDRKFSVPWGHIADPSTRETWRADACRLLGIDATRCREPRVPALSEQEGRDA